MNKAKYLFWIFLVGVVGFAVYRGDNYAGDKSLIELGDDLDEYGENALSDGSLIEGHEHGAENEDVGSDYYEEVDVEPREIEKAGYIYRINKARYEYDPHYLKVVFKVDVTIINNNFEPYVTTGGNCDLMADGRVIREGAGIQLSEITNVYPGEELSWQFFVPYDNGRRVGTCKFSPTGAYDPNITVEFRVLD